MSEVYFTLNSGDFLQDWSNTNLISVNNDWSAVPSIKGFLGSGMTSLTGVDPQTLTTVNSLSQTDSVIANQTNTALTSGGIAEFQLANPTIALQASGTASAPYLVLYLDASGRSDVTLSFNARDIDATVDNAIQQIAVQYRIGNSGDWINLPAGYIADATSGPSLATQVTPVSVTLPATVNGQSQIQVRILTTNAVGSDEWVGIDDIRVTSQAASTGAGELAVNDVSLIEGNAGTTEMVFTVTRSGGSNGAVDATWTVQLDGSADAADFASAILTGSVHFADGQTTATITVPIAGDLIPEGDETFSVVLSNVTNATLVDGLGAGTILNDELPGALSINDVTQTEGDAGTTNMVFTVTRSGGSDGVVGATWTVNLTGSADSADFAGPLTGTVEFAAGQTSATITVPVAGDVTVEAGETFTVTLSDPVGGATILDGSGAGLIANDDLGPVANVWINEINYDPAGTDTNEFVEIAGLAGVDLTGYKLVLYNGNGGASYATLNLAGTLADSAGGFGFAKVAAAGLQNGSPDGIALVDNHGRVIQFLSYEGPMTATNGPAAGMTSTDIGVEQANAAIGFTLQLTGTGSSYGDFTWAANVANTEGAANLGQSFLSGTDQGQVRISDARIVEGNAGESLLTFAVHRAGGFATVASVDWNLLLGGSADAADLGAGAALAGTVAFGVNEFVKTVTIPVLGDMVGELNETLSIVLSNAAGNIAIVDGIATGTIVNDDPIPLTIMQIQGAGHVSEYVGQPVITSGIVTAVDTNGFYLQDPNGDGNTATSDAVFVFSGSAPGVSVGDAVTLTGTVAEFASTGSLSLTEIVPASVTVNSTGNALPGAVLIGADGVLPPSQVIDDDGLGLFDPASDGIDFWESLEGMRVTIQTPKVMQNTNDFGETDVVASLGVGATGLNDRGGVTISAGDFNPEKIQIDDRFGSLIGYAPDHTVGDVLGNTTGVLNYSFGNYEVLATEAVTVSTDVTLADEVSSLAGGINHLTIATYNLENLDPSDQKYEILGHDIVYNLNAPDILAVQEVQDANGAAAGGDLSGVSNAQGLIDAIYAASGIVYTYVEIAPATANSTGGEPNGNIRQGYFYRADRVSLVEGSLSLISDPVFNGTRKPLVATWDFQGQEFTTINVHFTSRGGSDPLWGATQPPADAGDAARTAQAAAVGAYIFDHLADDPALQFMILGDWNGFYFETAQTQLTDTGLLTNLATLLDAAERYSYVFEGNSQLLDNMLATGGLLAGAAYDAVHLNAQFSAEGRPTDHDPQLARLLLGMVPHDLALSNATVAENLAAGAVVGTLSATDAAGDVLTYSLLDDAGGRFAVDPATGLVTATQSLDYEAGASYSLVARVTDSAGQHSSAVLTIAVEDRNDAPVAAMDSISVDEDATSANLWSVLLGNDSDQDGDPLTITAVGTSGTLGTVEFNAAMQTLRYIADNDLFDSVAPGTSVTDSFTYTVSDCRGGGATATVTVGVNGIADSFTFTGTDNADTLTGTAGEDTIYGGKANDRLSGGAGHDWLQGDRGNDILTGGAGRDSFVFGKAFGDDVVTDFDKSQDRLVLLDGAAVKNVSTQDANGDSIADTKIVFTTGGSMTLLGVNSLAGVQIDSIATESTFQAAHDQVHLFQLSQVLV